MYKALERIDTDKELDALISFVEKRWDGFENLNIREIFSTCWEYGLEVSKHHFDQYGLGDVTQKMKTERQDSSKWKNSPYSKQELEHIIYYDAIYQLSMNMSSADRKVYEAVMTGWDFSTHTKTLTNMIKKSFPDTSRVKPKGWSSLSKEYSDFNGMDEYCENEAKIDMADFQGCNSDTAGASGFHGRVVLPYVMYDDKCQGRKPLYTLCGSIMAHAMFVNNHNNTLEIVAELGSIAQELNQPQYYNQIQHTVNIEVHHPLVKALCALAIAPAPTEEEFKKSVDNLLADIRNYQKMTPEEKEALAKSADMSDIFMKNWDSPEEKKKRAEEDRINYNIVSSILNPTTKKKIKP